MLSLPQNECWFQVMGCTVVTGRSENISISEFLNFLIFMQIFDSAVYFVSEDTKHKLAYLTNLNILYTSIRCIFCIKISHRQACALCFPKWKVSQIWRNSNITEEILKKKCLTSARFFALRVCFKSILVQFLKWVSF